MDFLVLWIPVHEKRAILYSNLAFDFIFNINKQTKLLREEKKRIKLQNNCGNICDIIYVVQQMFFVLNLKRQLVVRLNHTNFCINKWHEF